MKHRAEFLVEELSAILDAVQVLDAPNRGITSIDDVAAKAKVKGRALRAALRFLDREGYVDLMVAQNRTQAERDYRHGWYDEARGYIAYVGLHR